MTLAQVLSFIATTQKLQGLQRCQRRPSVALGQDVDAPPGVNRPGTVVGIRGQRGLRGGEVLGQVKPTWEAVKNEIRGLIWIFIFFVLKIYGEAVKIRIWMHLGHHWIGLRENPAGKPGYSAEIY